MPRPQPGDVGPRGARVASFASVRGAFAGAVCDRSVLMPGWVRPRPWGPPARWWPAPRVRPVWDLLRGSVGPSRGGGAAPPPGR
eukprot:5517326-Lingulodinium_polyedra.AAC.1